MSLTVLSCFSLEYHTTFAAVNDDSFWYAGKGAKEKMYMVYQVRFNDIDDGKPFLLSMYFEKFVKYQPLPIRNDSNLRDIIPDKEGAEEQYASFINEVRMREQLENSYWIVPVIVKNYRGETINGTFNLRENDFDVLSSSNVSKTLEPYQDAFRRSLSFFSYFATQENPKSLLSPHWGKLQSPFSLGNNSTQPKNITVPAGTFNGTQLISFYGRPDANASNGFWINKDLPYPIKATMPAMPFLGQPLTFEFELIRFEQDVDATPSFVPEFGSFTILSITAGMIAVIGAGSKWQARKRN